MPPLRKHIPLQTHFLTINNSSTNVLALWKLEEFVFH